MKVISSFLFLAAAVPFLAGCGKSGETKAKDTGTQAAATNPAEDSEEADIRENLAKLSPEDRKLAEAQKFCAVQNGNRLGEMGPPVKLMLNDQPVFLCCGHCEKKAKADAAATVAKVRELKAKVAQSHGG
jgi:hypothetical protein